MFRIKWPRMENEIKIQLNTYILLYPLQKKLGQQPIAKAKMQQYF